MASNAPRVFREQTTFQNQKIGVARVYDGGQTGRAIVNGANRIAATAFQFAAEDAQEIGADEGKARTVQDIITINPETGEPQAISGIKGLGRIASRAYNRVIETRFKQHIGEELMNRGKVLAAQFATDPDGYAETYGDYIAQMAGNAKGKWGEFIREAGTSYLNRTRATIMANGIRAANARYARGVSEATEVGNQNLQRMTREYGPSAFVQTLSDFKGNLTAEPGGPGAAELQMGTFIGPTLEASIRPDGGIDQVVVDGPSKLSFGDLAPSVKDPAYAVSDAQQERTTAVPNTMFDQPIPRSPLPDFISGMLFEGGPQVAPPPPQANFGTLAGQIAASVTTGYMDALYAGIVNEATVRQFDSSQRANIVIGLTGYALDQADLDDPATKAWMNKVALAVETQDWEDLSRLIPGVRPFVANPFRGADLKLMGTVIEGDITNYNRVISDNAAAREQEAKIANEAARRRLMVFGPSVDAAGSALMTVLEDLSSYSNDPINYIRKANEVLLSETGLLAEAWREINNTPIDQPDLFNERVAMFQDTIAAVGARPLELLIANGSLDSRDRDQLLAELSRLNNGFSVRLSEVSPEVGIALRSIMGLKQYDPDVGEKIFKRLDDFISDEAKVLAAAEKLEADFAVQEYVRYSVDGLRTAADNGSLGHTGFLDSLLEDIANLQSIPGLTQERFNTARDAITREAVTREIGLFAGKISNHEQFELFSDYMMTGNQDILARLDPGVRGAAAAVRERLVVDGHMGSSASMLSSVLADASAAVERLQNLTARNDAFEEARLAVMKGAADPRNNLHMAELSKTIAANLASFPDAGFIRDTVYEADFGSSMMDDPMVRKEIADTMLRAGAPDANFVSLLKRVASGMIPTATEEFDPSRALSLFADLYESRDGRMLLNAQFVNEPETLADLHMYSFARSWMPEDAFREFISETTGMRGLERNVNERAEAVFGKSPEAWAEDRVPGYGGLLEDEKRAVVRMATVYAGNLGATASFVEDRIKEFSHNFYQSDPGTNLFFRTDPRGEFHNSIRVPLSVAFAFPMQSSPIEEADIVQSVNSYLTQLRLRHNIDARLPRGNLGEGLAAATGSDKPVFSLVERGWISGDDGNDYMQYQIFLRDTDGRFEPLVLDGELQGVSGNDPFFRSRFFVYHLMHEYNITEEEAVKKAASENAVAVQGILEDRLRLDARYPR
jgi:hypothetical protein